jgi:N-acetylmuramoyl-L-alanine amidase
MEGIKEVVLRKSSTFNLKPSIFALCALCVLCVSGISAGTLDIIVIDPGHGGKDPGTIGLSGSKEKDINLSISLKLHRLIASAFPKVKVVLTRSSDEFIEVKDRSTFANSVGAKLFISIHCNHKKEEETEKNGFEIYVLNRERFSEAVDVTARENHLLKIFGSSHDTVANFIFSTLAQNAYLKYSRNLASFLSVNLQDAVAITSRGVIQSGFWVLLGSSMPSALVECGYLSDKNDESYLNSEAGQTAFAQSLFEGFSRYKLLYESYH